MMRPRSVLPTSTLRVCTHAAACTLIAAGSLGLCVRAASAQSRARPEAPATSAEERVLLHSGTDWPLIASHLPDPATATPQQLEGTADVLRARRFPEDALDFYGYALARGGDVTTLLNKMGIVRLELRQVDLARQMFHRAVSVHKKDPQAWNNLGASEYASQNYRAAVSDYRKATKLRKDSAIYHSNLGMAYFELKDVDSARREFATALKLDPLILQHRDSGGSTAHILASSNYAGLCYEMARMYARDGKVDAMLEWLAKASEGGYPVRANMRDDASLRVFQKDPRVLLLLSNADQLTAKNSARPRTIAVALPGSPQAPPPD